MSSNLMLVKRWVSGQQITHTCWKRLMLSRMLNCCQRLEKFTLRSIKSGFPRWTNVKSCRIKPLSEKKQQKKHFIHLYIIHTRLILNVYLIDKFCLVLFNKVIFLLKFIRSVENIRCACQCVLLLTKTVANHFQ